MDRAARRTDQKLAAMEKRLTQIYSRAHGEISEKWAAYVNSYQERAKPLYDAIQAATTPEEKKKAQADFSRYVNNVIRDNQRYQDLTEQFAANLTNVNKTAQAEAGEGLLVRRSKSGRSETACDGEQDPITVQDCRRKEDHPVEYQEGERRSNARHYTGRQHPGHCEAFKERYRNEPCVVCTKRKNDNDKRTE